MVLYSGIIIAAVVGIALVVMTTFIIIIAVTDYRPGQTEDAIELYTPENSSESSNTIPDSLSILCWNIGYGGLGDNMDFFYDGGSQIQDTRERTHENLTSIISTIQEQDADIILLQEVDIDSRRSYHIDQAALLHKALPDYYIYFAYNYRSLFVPIPLRAPIGKVASGLVILSKYRPDSITRHQYPSKFPFPVSMFNLKRCLLTAHFTLSDGTGLIVGNTHNTAYDTGNMRSIENRYLAELIGKYHKNGIKAIIGGDWNQYPADYFPSPEESDNENFSTVQLDEDLFTPYGRIEYSEGQKTLRHLDRIYDEHSVLTVTDYFFLTNNLESSKATVLPLDFRNSDHNPVIINITLLPTKKSE